MKLFPTLAFALGSSLAFSGRVLAVTPWLERYTAIGSTKPVLVGLMQGTYYASWSNDGVRYIELKAGGEYHWYDTVRKGDQLLPRPEGLEERGTWAGSAHRLNLSSTAGVQRMAYVALVGEAAEIQLEGTSYRQWSIVDSHCDER